MPVGLETWLAGLSSSTTTTTTITTTTTTKDSTNAPAEESPPAPPSPPPSEPPTGVEDTAAMDTVIAAEPLLHSFITKTLRVTTKDTRMFVGELKCTDRDANLILSRTHEYRMPKFKPEDLGKKLDLTSRFLGLVVVMGVDIDKIELEEGAGAATARSADDGMES